MTQQNSQSKADKVLNQNEDAKLSTLSKDLQANSKTLEKIFGKAKNLYVLADRVLMDFPLIDAVTAKDMKTIANLKGLFAFTIDKVKTTVIFVKRESKNFIGK